MAKKNTNKKLSAAEIRTIKVMSDVGNTPGTISEVLKISVKEINNVLNNLYKYEAELAPLSGTPDPIREQIGEFERILQDKTGAAKIGKELYTHMANRHKEYKSSWVADSNCKFNFKSKWIGIVSLADFHIGHEGVDYDRLMSDLQLVANTPDLYVAFLGDAIDNFINGDKHLGAIINAVTSPKDQLYMLQYALSVLKEPAKKVLFVTKDNHVTQRLKNATGIDWSNKMWSDLNIFYGGEEIRCEISLGKQSYVISARHSYRGRSSVHLTASAKTLLKNGKYGDADIVMLAHTHEGAAEIFHYRGIPRVAIQASTYKLFDPYAKSLGYDDPNIFMPVILLNPDKKEFCLCQDVATAATMLKALNKGR